jgi:ribosome maturation factor RimP
MSSAAAAQVQALIEPVVSQAGLDLEDVVVRSVGQRRIVQVLVDRDGGIDLDAVAAVSRACSDALDTVELFGGAYELEISSPGVDRPLTEPRHWRRNTGRLVHVTLRDGKDVTGRIVGTDDAGITLNLGKTQRTIRYAETARGAVQIEFTRAAGAPPAVGDEESDEEAER